MCTLIAVVLMYFKYAHSLLYLNVYVHPAIMSLSKQFVNVTTKECHFKEVPNYEHIAIVLVHYNLLYNSIYIYRSYFDICIIEIS